MKKIPIIFILISMAIPILLAQYIEKQNTVSLDIGEYPNGIYRGTYEDSGIQQVGIEFKLTDGIISNINFRHLAYKDVNYLELEEGDVFFPIKSQHDELLMYLENKPLETIYDLYNTQGKATDYDGFTSATLRGSKLISAIQDGLNRGAYRLDGTYEFATITYPDGVYRGTFNDSGVNQISVEFTVVNNTFSDLKYRHLYTPGTDYLELSEDDFFYPVYLQKMDILNYLDGKPLNALYDLYKPQYITTDMDSFTAATLRSNKVLSAIQDGLNRGVYRKTTDIKLLSKPYKDGKYRGVYIDGGVQQVSIEFTLKDNKFQTLEYRHLFYKDIDYKEIDSSHEYYPVYLQNLELLEYLKDKPIDSIYDLYDTAFIEDIDGFTGATLRASKIISAIQDGLNRGLY